MDKIAGNASTEIGESLGTQIVKVSDGYGSPILFASLFVYIVMRLFVKPLLVGYLVDRGFKRARREPWILRATLAPGIVAALLVDFSPISEAVGVPLHPLAVIPVAAIFYSAGGVALHELIKRADPIGRITGRPERTVEDSEV